MLLEFEISWTKVPLIFKNEDFENLFDTSDEWHKNQDE